MAATRKRALSFLRSRPIQLEKLPVLPLCHMRLRSLTCEVIHPASTRSAPSAAKSAVGSSAAAPGAVPARSAWARLAMLIRSVRTAPAGAYLLPHCNTSGTDTSLPHLISSGKVGSLPQLETSAGVESLPQLETSAGVESLPRNTCSGWCFVASDVTSTSSCGVRRWRFSVWNDQFSWLVTSFPTCRSWP